MPCGIYICLQLSCLCSPENGIAFDQFLHILHAHSQAEDCENEIMAAFAAQDRKGNGLIAAADFKAIMSNSGEKVNPKLGITSLSLVYISHPFLLSSNSKEFPYTELELIGNGS